MSEPKLPRAKHFHRLSRRALAAFAARCVQRTESLPPYRHLRHDLEQVVETLWQYSSDLSDEPDVNKYEAELQEYNFEPDVASKALRTSLRALRGSGEDALHLASDLARATYQTATDHGRDIARLIRHDVKALYELAPGPFPELGDPFEQIDLEVKSPLWPDKTT